MGKKFYLYSVLILLIILLVGCGGKKGTLQGTIHDGESTELLEESAKLRLAGQVVETGSGEFAFTDVPSGTHTLEAEVEGYYKYSENVAIVANGTKEHAVRLQKEIIAEVEVPKGINPVGVGDSPNLSPINAFYISKYEISFKLWQEVRDWAEKDAIIQYTFRNRGKMGGKWDEAPIILTKGHPVTEIMWYDAIVWCNALTEYHNHLSGDNLECVYKSAGGTIFRDSSAAWAPHLDAVIPDPDAKGFRLPTALEWERAARYKAPGEYYPGSHASGDTTAPCWTESGQGVSTVYGDYAWHPGNSSGYTHQVGQKEPNGLGTYDMSGNVAEWCFTKSGADWRQVRGGSGKFGGESLRIGSVVICGPDWKAHDLGFRPVRTK